jgi:phosphonate C-P lyase system protein PhnG
MRACSGLADLTRAGKRAGDGARPGRRRRAGVQHGRNDGHALHAYVAGRDRDKAKLAALADAMLQQPQRAALLQERVIAPLEQAQRTRRETTARKAEATRVQFFTLASMRT